jgi:hypothetical protein
MMRAQVTTSLLSHLLLLRLQEKVDALKAPPDEAFAPQAGWATKHWRRPLTLTFLPQGEKGCAH